MNNASKSELKVYFAQLKHAHCKISFFWEGSN
jgi:hypothetical protein